MDFDAHIDALLALVLVAVVFVPIELLRPAHAKKAPSWQRYRTDLLHAIVGGFVIRLGIIFATFGAYSVLGPVASIDGVSLWIQIPVLILLTDLCIWLVHRTFHASPVLWKFHQVHHSSEQLDWLATYRVHPVEQVITGIIMNAPVLFLEFSPVAIVVQGVIYRWYSFLLHSNVELSFGPLNRIFATPGFHHWHHADQVEAYDRNFGAQFVIWDRMFGTTYESQGRKPERFGLSEPLPENFIDHMLSPFKKSV